MKYTSLRAFEKHLEGAYPKHFSDIYFILSKDDFERKAAIDKLVSYVLKDQNNPSMSVQTFDADKVEIQELLGELNAMVFFAPHRVLILQQADKLDKTSCEKLIEYFEAPNRSVCFVLSAAAINHSTSFYKKGEKAGVFLEVAEEKPWEKEKSSVEKMAAIVATSGKTITPQTCQYLLKQIGSDQATIHNELQKLICYIGERREITMQDVGAVSVNVNLENIWQLGEAIFKRDPASALRICKALLLDGSPFLGLLRQIRTQFQTEFQVCTILDQGGSSADVAAQFPYMKGNILERHVQMAQNYGFNRFKKALLYIDEMDVKAKNSALDSDLLAELLIVKLTV